MGVANGARRLLRRPARALASWTDREDWAFVPEAGGAHLERRRRRVFANTTALEALLEHLERRGDASPVNLRVASSPEWYHAPWTASVAAVTKVVPARRMAVLVSGVYRDTQGDFGYQLQVGGTDSPRDGTWVHVSSPELRAQAVVRELAQLVDQHTVDARRGVPAINDIDQHEGSRRDFEGKLSRRGALWGIGSGLLSGILSSGLMGWLFHWGK